MAKNDDIERLLAETEASLGGRAKPAAAPPAKPPGRLESSARVAAISGAVSAALVFVIFGVLPFLRAPSGAAGAFVATFVIVLAQRVTGRKR